MARYRKLDALDWIFLDSLKNGDTINDLDFCTEYEVQIGSKLGLLPAEYSYSKFFTTAGCCVLPELQNIISSVDNITFDWSTPIDATLIISYRLFGSDDTTTVVTIGDFSLDSLIKCKAYVFNMQAQCTKYGNQSSVSEDIIISTSCDQCTALNCSLKGDNNEEWIDSVSIDNETFFSQRGSKSYINYAGAKEFILQADSVYTISLAPGYKGSSFREYFYVFIDFNQDGNWTVDERIFYTPDGTRELVRAQFSVPADSKLGYTRMRVIMSYDTLSGTCDQARFEYGEVEDYCVNIKASNCVFDNHLKLVSSINTLKFYAESPLQPTDSIQVFYREAGSIDYQRRILKDTLIIEGLKKCTEYQYYFESACGESGKYISSLIQTKTLCIDNTDNFATKITVYPNPTKGDLTLILDNLKDIQNKNVIIKDLVGRNYLPVIKFIEGNTMNIDLQHLPSGVYLLHYDHQYEFISSTIKIIKL
jgi:serine protease